MFANGPCSEDKQTEAIALYVRPFSEIFIPEGAAEALRLSPEFNRADRRLPPAF
jgi:hypothetical protein